MRSWNLNYARAEVTCAGKEQFGYYLGLAPGRRTDRTRKILHHENSPIPPNETASDLRALRLAPAAGDVG